MSRRSGQFAEAEGTRELVEMCGLATAGVELVRARLGSTQEAAERRAVRVQEARLAVGRGLALWRASLLA